jgi:hypothetical protein
VFDVDALRQRLGPDVQLRTEAITVGLPSGPGSVVAPSVPRALPTPRGSGTTGLAGAGGTIDVRKALDTVADIDLGVTLADLVPARIAKAELQRFVPDFWAETPLWSASAGLGELPTDRPLRLCLREFERFYTDRTVPQVYAGRTQRAKVVEERLVYAEFFAVPAG